MTCHQRNPMIAWAVVLLAALLALCLCGRAGACGLAPASCNLLDGGEPAFQYDAWNRLVQVNEAIANQGFTEPGPGADEIDEDVFDAAAPVNRAGHKGLFADRLDVGVVDTWGHENCRLIPGAELAFYNRNRTYSPYLGRFLQSDPNATGVAICISPAYHGSGVDYVPSTFMVGELYRDGLSIYQYLRSSPINTNDPLGLYSSNDWWDDTKSGAEAVLNGFVTFTAGADPGGLIGAVLEAMVTNYSMNLEADAEWAGDWSQGDDWHTRTSSTWVQEAMLLGTYRHFNLGYWLDSEAQEPEGHAQAGLVRGIGKTVSETAKRIKNLRANMVFKSYYIAKAVKAAKDLGSLWDAYHLLPRAWAKLLGLNENGPAVLLTKPKHQPITTELNNILARQLRDLARRNLPEARRKAHEHLRKVYSNHSDWLEAIDDMFKGAK